MKIQTQKGVYLPKSEVFERTYPHFSLGDVVRVIVDPYTKDSGLEPIADCIGRVRKIEPMWGLINNATTASAPIVTLSLTEDNERSFSASWVCEVVSRAKKAVIKRNPNIFYEDLKNDPSGAKRCNVKGKNNVLFGPLPELARLFLAKMQITLNHFVDAKKLGELYEKDNMPGCIGSPNSIFFYVKKKSFGKWVRKNALKICMTSNQMRAHYTSQNLSDEKEYWEEVQEEHEKSLTGDCQCQENQEPEPIDPDDRTDMEIRFLTSLD
ncbi:MAG: hypothetical protein ACP5OG_03010 [Candidatus Nanoarchaeia archaeon]